MGKFDSRDRSAVFPAPPPFPLSASTTIEKPNTSTHNAPITRIFPVLPSTSVSSKAIIASELYSTDPRSPNRHFRRRNESHPFRPTHNYKPSKPAITWQVEEQMRMLKVEWMQLPLEARKMLRERLYWGEGSGKRVTEAFGAPYEYVHGLLPQLLKNGGLLGEGGLNGMFTEIIMNCLEPEDLEESYRDLTNNGASGSREEGDDSWSDKSEFDEDEEETQTAEKETLDEVQPSDRKPTLVKNASNARNIPQLNSAFATKINCSSVQRAMMEKAVTGFKRIAEEHFFNKITERTKPPRQAQSNSLMTPIVPTPVGLSSDEEEDEIPTGSPTPRPAQTSPRRVQRSASPKSEFSSLYSYISSRRPARGCRAHTSLAISHAPSEPASFWNIFVNIRLAFDENNHVINADTGKDLGTLMEFATEACLPSPVPVAVMKRISELELRLRNTKNSGRSRHDYTDPRSDPHLDKVTAKRNKKQDHPPRSSFDLSPSHTGCIVEALSTAEGVTYIYTFDNEIKIRTHIAPMLKLTGQSVEILNINDPAVPKGVRDAAIRVKSELTTDGRARLEKVRTRRRKSMTDVVVEERVVLGGDSLCC